MMRLRISTGRFPRSVLPVLAAVWFAAAGSASLAPAADRSWQMAQRTYETAMSQYKQRNYAQAMPLLKDFIRKYGSHEAVPVAHLQLANCYAELKQWDEHDDTLDALIRKFGDDPAWFLGWGRKLARLRDREDHEGYLQALEEFSRKARQLPYEIAYHIRLDPGWSWYQVHHRRDRTPQWMRWLVDVFSEPGWEADIVKMADTPERASAALRALRDTLGENEDELPSDWQFAHVKLLLNAGKPAEARSTFQAYSAAWGQDPRGMGLWVLWAEHHQKLAIQAGAEIAEAKRVAAGKTPKGKNDPKVTDEQKAQAAERIPKLTETKKRHDALADAAYKHLRDTYLGYFSLSALFGPRLEYLAAENRYDDFVDLAKTYLDAYPQGNLRRKVADNWLELLRPAALNGDPEALDKAIGVLKDYYGLDSGHAVRWLLQVYMSLKQTEKVVETARWYIQPEHWGRNHYEFLKSQVGRVPELGRLVDEAKKTYKIYDPAGGEAKATLDELKKRMKDEQVRFMEELAQKLFTQHRQTGEAVEAVGMMVEYYFKKVLPPQRDQWVNRMVEAYPRHPQTDVVMNRQIHALQAANQYEALGQMIDLHRERFPGGFYGHWRNWRLEAYKAEKDYRGAMELAEDIHGDSAREGNYNALNQLYNYQRRFGQGAKETSESASKFWLDWAKKLEGTRGELYCLHAALGPLYHRPYHHPHLELEVMTDEALRIIKKLQDQTLDPEIAWNMRFADIEVYCEQDMPDKALQKLQAYAEGKDRIFDLSRRVDFWSVGKALASSPKTSIGGLRLAKDLERAVFTSGDVAGVLAMVGEIYYHNKKWPQAEREYMDIVQASPWPVRASGAIRHAMEAARRQSHGRAYSLLTRYISSIRTAQSVIPGMLADQAKHALNARDATFKRLLTQLTSRYPASSALGEVQEAYEKKVKQLQEQKRKK